MSATNGLRVIFFNILPPGYQIVSRWAAQTGAEIVLVVTTQGPRTRPTPSYREVIALAAADRRDVLATTRLRRIALPLITALQPDLILSMAFPYRIPPEITAIPRYGAVNLHPTPLPAYRGPNPMRPFYDGAPTFGATLHRTEEDFDTGVIFSKQEAPMPDAITPEAIFAVWPRLMHGALAEGVARAVAGEPGEPQDHRKATYAGEFTEAECWLDWQSPAKILQRRTTALNLIGSARARAKIDDTTYMVQKVEPIASATASTAPGTVLERTDDGCVIAVADGAMRVVATQIEAS